MNLHEELKRKRQLAEGMSIFEAFQFLKEDDEETQAETQDENGAELPPDAKEKFDALIQKIKETSYSNLDDVLNKIMGDPKLKKLFELGFGTGEYADVTMDTQTTSIPVTQLHPTQNEIGMENSLKYPLEGSIEPSIFSGSAKVVAPIITYNQKYIIDGHHRWSQIYVCNPKAKVEAINFSYSNNNPMTMLRDLQGAIALSKGKITGSAGSATNIYACDESKVKEYITSNITDKCVEGLSKYVKSITDKDTAIDYLTKNCMLLKAKNGPVSGAPDRIDMPQTDAGAIKIAQQGLTNI